MAGYSSLLFSAAFMFFLAGGVMYVLYFLKQTPLLRLFGYGACVCAFAALTPVIILRMSAAGSFSVSGLYDSLLFLAWSIAGVYLFLERKGSDSVHAIFVLPLVSILLGAARFIDSAVRPVPSALQSPLLGIHVTLCFLGYACFVLGFCFAILYLWQEKEVKSKNVDRYFFRLPSLGLLDSLGYKTVAAGFILFSLGIAIGSVWAHAAWGSFWSWDPKQTSSLVLWLVYVSYFQGRLARGWKGRRSAYLAIAGFIVMVFTYVGVLLMPDGLHAYL